MRRSRLRNLLHDYVAGDLDAETRHEVEQLLESDADARAVLDDVRRAHDALSLLRDRPEPPMSAADVMPRIQASIAADGFRERPRLYLEGEGTRYYRRVAMAATILFAVTVGLFVYNFADGIGADDTGTPRGVAGTTTPALRVPGIGDQPMTAEEYFRRVGESERPVYVLPVINAAPLTPDEPEGR